MQPLSRRDVLQAAAALTTTASVTVLNPSLALAEESTGAKPASLAQIDAALRGAVDAKEVPGVVAMAATDNGLLYEGVFGTRDLGKGSAMTRDTVFRIASMTKAVTSVAAMQLVEQGKLKLNEPVPDIDSALSSPQVLEGFDASGAPRLRPAKRPITLRHLLTHTAGFTYEVWDANTQRYLKATGTPSPLSGKLAGLRTPLAFDPGDRWLYGVNIDWAGRIVEATSGQPLNVYFREHILGPLGMNDTGFATTPEQRARQASVHQRNSDGSLEPQPLETQFTPEFLAGGGGLYSTAPDYLTFLQMLLHGGSWNGARILRPETVAQMGTNQIGDIEAGVLKTYMPARSNDVDFFPGMPLRWGLGYMMNLQPGPDGRSADSLTWAGVFNTYYWIDPSKHVAGVIMTQVLPFADHASVRLYGQFERGIYNALKST
jgi:CubicO group peptidase (beta-lactamase class C family)